jgi:hypothetical protein
MDSASTSSGSAAFSPITFNDHAGKLWIVTILALIYSSLAVMARAYIKYKMLGLDDLFLALATVRRPIQNPVDMSISNIDRYWPLDFAFRPVNRNIRWLKQWPWQVQLYHAAGTMGNIFKGEVLPIVLHLGSAADTTGSAHSLPSSSAYWP